MTLIKLEQIRFYKNSFPLETWLEEQSYIWVNINTICHLEWIPNPTDDDADYVTQIKFNFGLTDMEPGMTITVVESPEQIKALIKKEVSNDRSRS